jgi:hypothetical protein
MLGRSLRLRKRQPSPRSRHSSAGRERDRQSRRLVDYGRSAGAVSPLVYQDELTDEQILALRREAAEAGDDRQVITRDLALAGDDHARMLCASAISDAQAQ